MTTAVIIVAAGRGTRVGGQIPKQWRDLAGRTVIERSVEAFHGCVDTIVVVLNNDDRTRWDKLNLNVDMVVEGGASRNESVYAGLVALKSVSPRHVLIHDAARPLVSQQQIIAVKDALLDYRAAAPAIAVSDALWKGANGFVNGLQSRDALYRAQTPQGFSFSEILKAHEENAHAVADDVEVARNAGMQVKIVDGDPANLKITTERDFERAKRLLMSNIDVRTGNGFDVHRFGDGDHVWLCGVRIPHKRSLQGHSDADVGMHAITDALYGALGRGDIGQHFPPSDPQWKGAESSIFLKHAVALATKLGFSISNIDCTIICEFPKIGPHQETMKATIADLIGIDADRISVKATTSEKLGFAGREGGIATIATATLVKS